MPCSTGSSSTGSACSWSCARRRTTRSTTATRARLFPGLLERLGRDESVQAVVLARTPEQRAEIVARRLPSLVVPEHAVDAQSLIALSDLVVSAGGTMNREAAALGVPVYTTFGGRIGAVDEALLAEGRLRQLTDPARARLAKREAGGGVRTRSKRLPGPAPAGLAVQVRAVGANRGRPERRPRSCCRAGYMPGIRISASCPPSRLYVKSG